MSGKLATAMCSRSVGYMCGCMSTYPRFSKILTRGQGLSNVDGLGLLKGPYIQRVQPMSKFTARYDQPQTSNVRKVSGVKRKVGSPLNMATNLVSKQQSTNKVLANKKTLLKKQRDLQVLAMIQEILCRKQVNRSIISDRQESKKPVDLHAQTQHKHERIEEPVKNEIFFRTHNIVKPEVLKPKEQKMKEVKTQPACNALLVVEQMEENPMRDTTFCVKQYEKPTRKKIVCEKPKMNKPVHMLEEALCTKKTEEKPEDKQNQKEQEPVQMFESIFYPEKSVKTPTNDANFGANEKDELNRTTGLIEKFFSRMNTDMFKNIFFRPHKKT